MHRSLRCRPGPRCVGLAAGGSARRTEVEWGSAVPGESRDLGCRRARMRRTATPPCSERLCHHALSPEPLELRVGDRGSAPGRVQAEPVRHARPSAHHPAPHGGGHGPAPGVLRGAGGQGSSGLRPGQPGAVPHGPDVLQPQPLHPGPHPAGAGPAPHEPAGLRGRVLPERGGPVHLLRVRQDGRQAGRARPPLPGPAAVRLHRPLPGDRQQRGDGHPLRGPDPPLRRRLQRDRR